MSRLQTPVSYDERFCKKFVSQKLGEGGYGQVFKAVDIEDYKTYAVKQIWLKDDKSKESFEKEVKMLLKLNSDYVIQVYCHWIEIEPSKLDKFAFIQMEFCSNDLDSLLENKADHFRKIRANQMNLFEYFISFELLRELTECLSYLHSQKPPIMHRDLKPANVLITNGANDRYLKLCDFGLSIIHENKSHTQNAGTREFMAPEVKSSGKYNLKADIYSLGITADKILETDLEYIKDTTLSQLEKVNNNKRKIMDIIERMKSGYQEDRPPCSTLLEIFDQIIFPPTFIEQFTKSYRLSNENNKDDFFNQYYNKRFEMLNNRMIESYHGDFQIVDYLDSGEFGSVVKVLSKNDRKPFILKKITLKGEHDKNLFKEEFEQLKSLNADFVVKYINRWLISEDSLTYYIKMEHCEYNLQLILDNRPRVFNRSPGEQMKLIEFFISFELFFELTKCLDYLHSLSPPILNKELIPEKVLIKEGNDGLRLKLGDFRIKISHDTIRKADEVKYVAKELRQSWREYTMKADMYRLGVIGKDIFDADLKYSKSKIQEFENNKLANIYENGRKIRQFLKDLRSTSKSKRPSSSELLTELKDILFVPSHLKSGINLCSLGDSETNNFYYDYYNNRIENLSKRLKNCEIKETNVYTLLEIARIENLAELEQQCLEFENEYLKKMYLRKSSK